ncbi:MAG: DNA polymerase IV [Myxococcales bacterium]|nr:DNA polymerase IV [Myxococcales bacterium]
MRRPRLCCLDLDTFFVSVERVLDPRLNGQPVIVGGQPGQRGVVAACSYEVRRLGVRSGMSLTDAGRRAPRAIYLPARQDTYGEFAEQVRTIARRYSPVVQVASIDEMYIDFAGCERLYKKGEDRSDDATIERVVWEMIHDIQDSLGLPASAGIASSRSTAKIASGQAKPAGVLLIPAANEAGFLAPLELRKLPGIGPVAAGKLESVGFRTLGDIATAPLVELRAVLGAWAELVKQSAQGEGVSSLGPERPAFKEQDEDGAVVSSISNERTFSRDVRDTEVLESMLCALSERVCWRARKRGVKGRTVSLKLRTGGFDTLTRSRTVGSATDAENEVYEVVRALLAAARPRLVPVRLVGVALSNLVLDKQLPLLSQRGELQETVDAIRDRFGYESVRLALGKTGKAHKKPGI